MKTPIFFDLNILAIDNKSDDEDPEPSWCFGIFLGIAYSIKKWDQLGNWSWNYQKVTPAKNLVILMMKIQPLKSWIMVPDELFTQSIKNEF